MYSLLYSYRSPTLHLYIFLFSYRSPTLHLYPLLYSYRSSTLHLYPPAVYGYLLNYISASLKSAHSMKLNSNSFLFNIRIRSNPASSRGYQEPRGATRHTRGRGDTSLAANAEHCHLASYLKTQSL